MKAVVGGNKTYAPQLKQKENKRIKKMRDKVLGISKKTLGVGWSVSEIGERKVMGSIKFRIW